jgi:glycosyltransferase involved in cell wall biosynthesis
MVLDGVSGLLAPEQDPVALAGACAQLLGDRTLARSLGTAGRERVAEQFSIERSIRALRAIFPL